MDRTPRLLAGAALWAAIAGAQPAHAQTRAATLSPWERHILAPVGQGAQDCLRTLAPLSFEVAAAIQDGGPPAAGSMGDDALAAGLSCTEGERYGVQRLYRSYPLRARSGHLHVVLVHLDALFSGGMRAAHNAMGLSTSAQSYEPDVDNSAQVAALEAGAETGFAQAVRARAALVPDLFQYPTNGSKL